MAFEPFTIDKTKHRLRPGTVQIGRTGLCQFHPADLGQVGIDGLAAVFIDVAKKRIGLKRPRGAEYSVAVTANGKAIGMRVGLRKVFERLCISRIEHGRRAIKITDDMIVMDFGNPYVEDD